MDETKGGAGSGNFGHAGRAGKRGGSAGGGYTQTQAAQTVLERASDPNWTHSFGAGEEGGLTRKHLSEAGFSKETIDQTERLLNMYGYGEPSESRAVKKITQSIQDQDEIGRALVESIALETATADALIESLPARAATARQRAADDFDSSVRWGLDVQRKGAYYEKHERQAYIDDVAGDAEVSLMIYRKGSTGKAVESWSRNSEGAVMGRPSEGGIGWDHRMSLRDIRSKGYHVLGGFVRLTGAPGEAEVTLIRWPINSPAKSLSGPVQTVVAPDGSFSFVVPLPDALKGGAGSGNFRHAGRPGERGGSAGGPGALLPEWGSDKRQVFSDTEARIAAYTMPADRDYITESKRVDIKVAGMNILAIDAACDTKTARAIQDGWASTSDDSGDWQDALQKNAYDETPDAANRLSEPDGIKELFNDYINTNDAQFDARSEGHWEIAEAASASIYGRTQSYLRSKGIGPNDELTLYRGMMVDKSTLDQFEPGGELFVKPRPLSSFALDYKTAYSFGSVESLGMQGAVFAVKVPAKSLFSHWSTGFGCADENEVVVKGDFLADIPWTLVSKGSHQTKATSFSIKAKRSVPATPDIVEDRDNADWLIRLQERASDEEGRPTDLELTYGDEAKGGAGSGNFGHAGRPGKHGGSAGGGASGLTSKYVQGRELTLEDAPEVAAFFTGPGYIGSFGDDDKNITNDVGLSKIIKAQGFDGKPELTSKEELDTLVEQGYTEIYRGVATDSYAEQFRTGELYIGAGSFGNGTYASTNIKTAKDYAGYDYQNDVYAKPVRMALRPEAKVLNYDELWKEGGLAHRFQRDDPQRDSLLERAKQAHEAGDKAGSDEFLRQRKALFTQDQAQHRIGQDAGRLAAFHGYDAIKVSQGGFLSTNVGEDYYVILNRTALVVER